MSNRPTRPTWHYCPDVGYHKDETDAYITALEQERDEAVDIIRAIRDSGALDDIDPPGSEWFDESQWSVNRRVLGFLACVEGANDD